ncbi:type II secretion system F family protein [Saccharopolyspora sp. HNM0983]|uniref:Type II secretion system F family protein n=1 Tax=Saccharopolyspora montiporae TaxID=2781240 RepID=A0A929B9Z6_9PSEU|nr:type II secretion system F family protein [Saccharopolyspora sp. HNM0983]MBE9374171.1 type II secretion system F family protein [Saccharopolyspora sp. HNM0983]
MLIRLGAVSPARRRARRRLRPRPDPESRRSHPFRPRHLALAACAAAGFVPLGVAGACAVVGLAGIAATHHRAHRQRCADLAEADALLGALRLVVAQLRAGAQPADAAEGAARECRAAQRGRPVAELLTRLASATRLGAGVGRIAEEHAVPRAPLAQLCRAWDLADRHGVGLAELLESVRRTLHQRAARVRDLESKMAGPRATARLLAVLPVFGLVMGESLGAGPVSVLSGTAVGQLLVLLGGALLCAGLGWTNRLTAVGVST